MEENRVYQIDYNVAYQIALDSANKCFNIQEQNISKGYIKCTTRSSLWSWGESILIRVLKIDLRQTKISIESSPTAQLLDWGKSKDNINIFFNTLEQNLR